MLPDTNSDIRFTNSGERFLKRGFSARVRAVASILSWKFPDCGGRAVCGGAADSDEAGRWDGAGAWDEAGCATIGDVPKISAKSRTGCHQDRGNEIPVIGKARPPATSSVLCITSSSTFS